MNKSISGLAMILITSGTAHAAAVPTADHDTAYSKPGAVLEISGNVITTVQEPPVAIVFTPHTLLSKSTKQIAAHAVISGTHRDSEYVLGTLTATGDDAAGYKTDTTSSWITTSLSQATTGSYRAIQSDGSAFYVTIVHEAAVPNPGRTLLNLPLTEYTK
ncbi:hypothetical protein ACFFW7_000781 [Salmonella enterica]|nr:hypothetical protein [Salmonella enterica]ECC3881673.1 hypothetical protein [Salmonella enterica subsp. diarizonae]ECT9714969.1 hypothetical protein [Salmonella enterica subsp. diarizonae str. CFSAN000553]SUG60097.1 Uncharacterised protein [Salmonella enterica subsp. arizonae]EAM4264208.1 hypothetical protein [Salmonella enterica]